MKNSTLLPMPKLNRRERGSRIAFFGPMCSGKTWAANYLVSTYGFEKHSFAAKIKGLAYELYGIEGKSGHERNILQAIGQDLRKHDPDVWIKYTLSYIKFREESSNYPNKIVIDDLRYENEANVLTKNGFSLIYVATPAEVRKERITRLYPTTDPSSYYHASETEWTRIRPYAAVDGSTTLAALDLDRILTSLSLVG